MEVSQKLLCFLFFSSLGMGFLLSCLYDLLLWGELLLGLPPNEEVNRSCKKAEKKHSLQVWSYRLWMFFKDIIWWIMATVSLILLLYFINDGQLRLMAPLAMILGFLFYRLTLRHVFDRVAAPLAQQLRGWIGKLVALLLLPVRWLARLLYRRICLPLYGGYAHARLRHRRKDTEDEIQAFYGRISSMASDENKA